VAITIPDLEQRAALSWRAPEEERVGDWLLRAAGGFTGRANSALAVGDPGRTLGQAADAVCHWYQARGLPAMIAIPYPAAGPRADPVDRFLAEQGWSVRSGTATVMTAPAGQIARAAGPVPAVPVGIDPEPDEAWLALYHYRGQQGLPPIARQVLTSAPWQAFASIRAGGQTIAIGRVAAAGGWAGLTAIEVAPAHRRRGLGTVVTAALAARAAAHGAGHLYLQVEDDNETARALYQRTGFAAHHGYHYRVAPAGQGGGPAPGTAGQPAGPARPGG
jgi:ribosomal protein S18 acetylase RimI-like enzyme